MASTLTIVASPPAGGNGRDDSAIAAVLDALEPIAAVPTNSYTLARASSIEDVAAILGGLAAAPSLIQIVGHGSPGMVWLGRPWDPRYAAGPQGPVFMLDSSPYYYGILRGLVGPGTANVWLLGCAVADVDASMATDGPTLLFDLAFMWGCTVGAPVDIIGAAEFDGTGKFGDPTRLMKARNRCVGTMPLPTEPAGNGNVEEIRFVELRAAPALGPREPPNIDLPLPHLLAGSLHLQQVEELARRGPILAAVEAVYIIRFGHSPQLHLAEVLANGRLVRVRLPAGDRTFIVPPAQRRPFRRAQRRVLQTVMQPP